MNNREIFDAALAIANPDNRAAYLDRVCGGDLDRRREIQELLDAQLRLGSFLESPLAGPGDSPTIDQPATEMPGAQIGPYKLLQEIGQGGMGVVYMAEQQQPVKRRVALKIIKPGMDTRQVIARFEAERQALSLMDHPNIAKVLDAGTTESGRPFFVMELVKGQPITQYCDEHHLTPRQRLELLLPVCQAIQHAHQKGIIHRDVKPTNILVAEYDNQPVPKVIDFGVAKAISQTLTEKTMFTGFGQIVGTLEYMSPEQAKVNQLDIDTRSDIYSLGVLMYELLTGTTPFDKERLRSAGWDEMLRIIREEEPPKPSTRLSDSLDSLSSISAQRQTEPGKLTRLVRGELDWIVMRALEKDRNRRYQTANGMAADIQHYLHDEPVLACPPSVGYRFLKFARRNKASLATAMLVAATLLTGLAGTSWQAIRATKAESEAQANADQANDSARRALASAAAERQAKEAEAEQRKLAETSRQRAESEKTIAQLVRAFLQQSLLGQADPWQQADSLLRAGGSAADVAENPTIRELLDRAAAELTPEKIETNFPSQPLVQAELLQTVGNAYRGVGEYASSVSLLKRAAELRMREPGPDHVDTLETRHNLALALESAGSLVEATSLLESVKTVAEQELGHEHAFTLTATTSLAQLYQVSGRPLDAIGLLERVMAIWENRPASDDQDLVTRNNLALAYQSAGRLVDAIREFERTKVAMNERRGAHAPTTLTVSSNLATAYQEAGHNHDAIRLLEEVVTIAAPKFRHNHPFLLMARNNLALAHQYGGKFETAIAQFQELKESAESELGIEHPHTLTLINNLASALQESGQLPAAILLFEGVKETLKQKGASGPPFVGSLNNLALAYQKAKLFDKAIFEFEQAKALAEHVLGPEHPKTLVVASNLGTAYIDAGRVREAIELLERTREKAERKLGLNHSVTIMSLSNLSNAYWSNNQFDLALPLNEVAFRRVESQLGRKHLNTLRIAANLGVLYRDMGRLDEAIDLLEEVYQERMLHPSLAPIAVPLVEAYVKAHRTADASRLLLEIMDTVRETAPDGSLQLAGELANVSKQLLDLKEYSVVEPLLKECLAIREQHDPDDWRTFNTKSMLGGALLGQRRYAEAEPLLVAGYEGMKRRETTIPEQGKIRLPEALDRLIELYTATGKPDEVQKWQAERAKYPPAAASATEKK